MPLSLPARIAIRLLSSIALVWALQTYLPQFFVVTGGWQGIVVVGVIIAVLNIVVRPLLSLITTPLKLIMTILASLIVNGACLWCAMKVVENLDPSVVTLSIEGGVVGWAFAIAAFGIGNWLLKIIVR